MNPPRSPAEIEQDRNSFRIVVGRYPTAEELANQPLPFAPPPTHEETERYRMYFRTRLGREPFEFEENCGVALHMTDVERRKKMVAERLKRVSESVKIAEQHGFPVRWLSTFRIFRHRLFSPQIQKEGK